MGRLGLARRLGLALEGPDRPAVRSALRCCRAGHAARISLARTFHASSIERLDVPTWRRFWGRRMSFRSLHGVKGASMGTAPGEPPRRFRLGSLLWRRAGHALYEVLGDRGSLIAGAKICAPSRVFRTSRDFAGRLGMCGWWRGGGSPPSPDQSVLTYWAFRRSSGSEAEIGPPFLATTVGRQALNEWAMSAERRAVLAKQK